MAVLGRVWAKWKALAQRIGDFQARVILTILYFLILGPLALLYRVFRDPLRLKRAGTSGWLARPQAADSLEAAGRQF
jgi:hypothetical protein